VFTYPKLFTASGECLERKASLLSGYYFVDYCPSDPWADWTATAVPVIPLCSLEPASTL
jgi:hypothetical protein